MRGACAVGLTAALAVLGTLQILGAAPASAATSAAVQNIGSCISGGKPADFLLLVDESSSLETSDPTAARATAARYLVDQLAAFADESKASISVEVSVFGDRYSRLTGWTALDGGTAPTNVSDVLSTLAHRTSGFDTDYWTALRDAQSDLTKRAGSSGGHCQALVWFTDGALSYSPRTDAAERQEYGTRKVFDPGVLLTSDAAASQVRAAAQSDLCRSGGLADQLRTSGITIIAIGLGSDERQFDLLRSVATGVNGTRTCGAHASAAPGAFYPASDITSLLLAFDAVSTPGSSPIEQTAGICHDSGSVCSGGAHDFVLDASTPGVRILGTANLSGLTAALEAPDGAVLRLSAGGRGTVNAGGAVARYEWITASAVSVDLDQDSAVGDAWSGQWRFAFIDPNPSSSGGRSRTNIHIRSSIQPVVVGGMPALHSGGTAEFHFGLTTAEGTQVAPTSLLGALRYAVTLRDAQGDVHQLLTTTDKTAVRSPVSVHLAGFPVGAATLTLEAQITTASARTATGVVAGTRLAPSEVSLPISISPPLTYPTVSARADFGTVTGAATSYAVLVVRGSGCIWIPKNATSVVALPQGVQAPSVTATADSKTSCRSVRSGDRVQLALSASGSGNGVLNGTVRVFALPADRSGAAVQEPVAVSADFQRPLNTTDFLLALIAALVLGPGLPLLLLYGLKWLTARIPSHPLAASVIDVVVRGGAVQRDGAPFSIRPADFVRYIPIARGGVKRLDADGLELRVRTGLSPVGAGYVVVLAGDRLAVSDTDGAVVRGHATLPLAVHGHFVVLRERGASAERCRVLVLLRGDASDAERRRMSDEIARRTPELLAALVAADPAPAMLSDPFAVGASSGGSTSASDTPWGF